MEVYMNNPTMYPKYITENNFCQGGDNMVDQVLRPIYIITQQLNDPPTKQKGLFHGWGGTSEFPIAIVELEDGSVESVHMHDIQFLDNPMATNQFTYAWEGGDNVRKQETEEE